MTWPPLSAREVGLVLCVALVTLYASRALPAAIRTRLHGRMAEQPLVFAARACQVAIWAMGLSIVLSGLGNPVIPFLTAATAIAVVTASSMGFLGNALNGILLLAEGNWHIGDTLYVSDKKGVLVDWQLRCHVFQDPDTGRLRYVSHSSLYGGTVEKEGPAA